MHHNFIQGYLGCSVDVLSILDAACSGKTKCVYPVSSDTLQELKPCMDLMPYLEVYYTCLAGKWACAYKNGII